MFILPKMIKVINHPFLPEILITFVILIIFVRHTAGPASRRDGGYTTGTRHPSAVSDQLRNTRSALPSTNTGHE